MEKKGSAGIWDAIWSESSAPCLERNSRMLENIESLFGSLNGKDLLELGAGRGVDARFLSEKRARVFALDFSFKSAKLVKGKSDSLNFVLGNVLRLPFVSNAFDLVYSQGTLEHFCRKEFKTVMQESWRVAKKGGFVLVDVPQKYSLYSVATKKLIKKKRWKIGWEKSFSFFELKKILEDNGFEFCCAYGSGFYPYFHKIGEGIIGRSFMPAPLKNFYLRLLGLVEKSFFGPFVCESIGIVGKKV